MEEFDIDKLGHDNPAFYDNETIPITPSGSMEETSFTTPSTTTAQSLELTKLKLQDLYRHLGVIGEPNLPKLERFRSTLNAKGVEIFQFLKSTGDWVNLTNIRDGKWLADGTLKTNLEGESSMIRHLGLEEIPERFKRQKAAARKLIGVTPTDLEMDSIDPTVLNRRVSNISQTIEEELPMRELLGLDKDLQTLKGDYASGVAKLNGIDEHIKLENTKLKQVKEDQGLKSRRSKKCSTKR